MAQLQVQANSNSSLKQMLWLVSFSNFMLQESGTEVQGLYRPPTWYTAQPEALPVHGRKSGDLMPLNIYTIIKPGQKHQFPSGALEKWHHPSRNHKT